MERLKIKFWKTVAIFWDLRPRLLPKKYYDYPIASCDIADTYEYPSGYKILHSWDEKGKHWIAFTRK